MRILCRTSLSFALAAVSLSFSIVEWLHFALDLFIATSLLKPEAVESRVMSCKIYNLVCLHGLRLRLYCVSEIKKEEVHVVYA